MINRPSTNLLKYPQLNTTRDEESLLPPRHTFFLPENKNVPKTQRPTITIDMTMWLSFGRCRSSSSRRTCVVVVTAMLVLLLSPPVALGSLREPNNGVTTIGTHSLSRARIVEWDLPTDDDDDDGLLQSFRKKRRRCQTWNDDDDEIELDTISNTLESQPSTSGVNNRESSSSSHFALALHLEEDPRESQPQHSPQSLIQSSWMTNDHFLPGNKKSNNNGLNTQNNNLDLKKRFTKTGTTIAGCICGTSDAQYVVLAADTRATEATMVADKRCQKLHQLATNSWCAGAGTSADLDHLTKECLFSCALQKLQESSVGNEQPKQHPKTNMTSATADSDENPPPVLVLHPVSMDTICNFLQEVLYKNGGNLGANLILGGVWKGQAHLRAIHPHGSMDIDLPFAALGSGGLAAMGVLEQGYGKSKDGQGKTTTNSSSCSRSTMISLEDGVKLVQRAIVAGIKNDLGSGSQVDLCVIHPDGSSHYQRCVVAEEELSSDDIGEYDPASARKKSALSSREEEEQEESETAGVNGFGNLPFAIQSKKTLFSNEIEEDRRSKWNNMLGL